MWLYTLLVLVLTNAPYVLALARQDEAHVFSGFLFGVEDGNSYLGKMRLGAHGEWNFHLFYTSEPHEGAGLIYLPYILPGQIVRLFVRPDDSALTGLLLGIFHAMRIVFDMLLIHVAYRFIAAFVRAPGTRLLGLLLATLGGGFGWLLLFAGQNRNVTPLPPEFYIPEGFTLLILLGPPHLALARAALLGGLLALFVAIERENPRAGLAWAGLAGACWLVVGIFMAVHLAVVYCILGAWGLAAWIRARTFPRGLALRAGTAALMTLPLLAYYALTFSRNPAFAQWSAQNALPSPPPFAYLLAYGPLALPALWGGRWAWRRANRDMRYALLVGWPLAVPVLVYLPINVQRRMAEAVIVPLAVLAAVGLRLLVGALARRGARLDYRKVWRRLRVAALAALLASSMFVLLGTVFNILGRTPRLYYETAMLEAADWLEENAQPQEVILSHRDTGNLLGGRYDVQVYLGHGPETLYSVDKERTVRQFYAGELTAAERAALYNRMNIRYVFYGPWERALADSGGAPGWSEGLRLVYEGGGYQIFEAGRYAVDH